MDKMLEELTPEEFDEWLAYEAIEPFDDRLSRETMVMMATAICRGLGMDVTPENFRMSTDPAKPKQKPASVNALKASLTMFAAMHNASL